MEERILGDASTTMKQAVTAHGQVHRTSLWRTIMRTRKMRFGAITTAAAILIVAVFLIKGTGTAWSLEQTMAAMKQIETLHITGKDLCGGEQVSFECWVRLPGKGSDDLKIRYQCGCKKKTTVWVEGNTVYRYWPVENVVKVLDGSKIGDLQYWYEGAKLSPWLTGTLIQTLRLFVDDWKQTVETDPNTGKEQILVTCSHPSSNRSLFLVVDPQTKLIQKARLWRNLERQGEPELDAQEIVYNPEIPDGFFEFAVPPGARIIDRKEESESRALFDQAERLFHQEKRYAEAVDVYWQVYNMDPNLDTAEEALMMIGLSYGRLGQHDKEIEAFEKAVKEFPELKGWIEATYFYLGCAYLDQGQNNKALEAFENCLKAGKGVRDPEKFPLKDAREAIARIKGG
jgi:outer membrane lipoprotein-sorting protein